MVRARACNRAVSAAVLGGQGEGKRYLDIVDDLILLVDFLGLFNSTLPDSLDFCPDLVLLLKLLGCGQTRHGCVPCGPRSIPNAI